MELEGFREITELLHCAVYALVSRREVVYIGKTKQPWQRLYAHVTARGRSYRPQVGARQVKKGIKFDQLFIHPCMLAELDLLELDMIAKYRPKHNVLGMPHVPSAEMDKIIADILAAQALVLPPPPVAQPRLHRRF